MIHAFLRGKGNLILRFNNVPNHWQGIRVEVLLILRPFTEMYQFPSQYTHDFGGAK